MQTHMILTRELKRLRNQKLIKPFDFRYNGSKFKTALVYSIMQNYRLIRADTIEN